MGRVKMEVIEDEETEGGTGRAVTMVEPMERDDPSKPYWHICGPTSTSTYLYLLQVPLFTEHT